MEEREEKGEKEPLGRLGPEVILSVFSQWERDIEEELKEGITEEDEAEKNLAAIERLRERLTRVEDSQQGEEAGETP